MRRALVQRDGAAPAEIVTIDLTAGKVAIPLGHACRGCHRRYEHADDCPRHDIERDPYPHTHLSRAAAGEDQWRCVPCGATGTYAELGASDCTADYPPCTTCGCTPECAPDCAGVLDALASPEVHVAGGWRD